MYSLSQQCVISRPTASAVAATTDLDGSVIDMAGFDGVLFVALLGDVTSGSVLELQCQGSAASNGSSPTQETGATSGTFTAGASSADGKLLVLDVIRPANRYVFPRLKRGTANAVVDGVVAVKYRGRSAPITADAGVIASALAVIG